MTALGEKKTTTCFSVHGFSVEKLWMFRGNTVPVQYNVYGKYGNKA